MKNNSKNTIDEFFGKEPSVGQKAWDIINQFYHLVLTKMEQDGVSRADLARRLGKSRAAISHMFNETPNITVKKMVEIADAVGLNINLTTEKFLVKKKNQNNKTNEKTINF
ncbi:MAG: helix-turn-helix transcriptional regulator [Candidatus Cloacimonetes bacterium]|nr:helix-turn-helix transcriptional regulator [Candidatus Cloacimonadota bacterium]